MDRRDFLMGAGSAIAFPVSTFAQSYPTRPVRLIVPFAPGGPTDVFARLLAQKLSANLGHQFYVENLAGGGANIGMSAGARAAPDGHTILFVTTSFMVNPSLYAKVPYDPYKDFAAVTLAAISPNILIVHPSVPAKTVAELIAFLKANQGRHSFAFPGFGTTPHLSGELLKLSQNLDLVHVPFNGSGPAIGSTIAGHTLIAFTGIAPAIPQIKEGKLRALAVTSSSRSSAMPEIPTLAESGLADQEADTLQGVLVPAGTPAATIDTLNREIGAAMASPEINERMSELGFEMVASTPDAFSARIRSEIPRWARVIRDANIKADQ